MTQSASAAGKAWFVCNSESRKFEPFRQGLYRPCHRDFRVEHSAQKLSFAAPGLHEPVCTFRCAEASTPSIATDCALSDWLEAVQGLQATCFVCEHIEIRSEWELCDRSCGGGQTVRQVVKGFANAIKTCHSSSRRSAARTKLNNSTRYKEPKHRN